MIILVTGGSGCGKSTWAEKLVQSLPSGKRVYIATMQVYDRESEIRVQRHRAQRAGLGFRTVECEKDLASAPVEDGSVVLLEDLVNLTANEMFDGGNPARIVPALRDLAARFPTAGIIPLPCRNTCAAWRIFTGRQPGWRTVWLKWFIPFRLC